MNREILQIAAASLLTLFSAPFLEALPSDNEIAMAKCTRTSSDADEDDVEVQDNIGPYDEEYGDGTDVFYGDGDGAPEAEDQSQSWMKPIYNKPQYYIPESTSQSIEKPTAERKSAAQRSVEKENSYSASN